MAYVLAKDGAGADAYMKVNGAGTTISPYAASVVVDSGSLTANLGTLNGAATAANQSTIDTTLNAIGTLVTTINGKITAVNTGAVVLATGANVIGALTANQSVNVAQINGVTPLMGAGNSGTGSPRVTLATDQVKIPIHGDIAHDSVDAGSPVKIGGAALSANPTAVATGDRVNALLDLIGRIVVAPYTIDENLIYGATSDITNTTSTSVIASPGGSLRNYITECLVQNSHATVGTWVNVTDGSAGTVMQTVYAAPLGGGAALQFPAPLRQTAATALHAVCVTTGANVRVSASGFKK